MRPPKTFHNFTGQPRVVPQLKRHIDGAKALGRPCLPLLFVAPPGFGKTDLAKAVAAEYSSTLHVVVASGDTRPTDLIQVLRNVQFSDFVFIDEAHSLSSDAQQLLYQALDEWKMPALEGGRLQRAQSQSIAEFTLILATDKPGSLLKALRSRMTVIEFDRYTLKELKAIAKGIAIEEGLVLTSQAARVLASASQGVPRHVKRWVQHLRYFRPAVQRFTQDDVDAMLQSHGVDARGLWPHQRTYLATLYRNPRGACSLERLSVKVGCDLTYVRQEIEPFLIEQGWVDPYSVRGRLLTDAGWQIANEIVAALSDTDDASEEVEEQETAEAAEEELSC